MVRTTMGSVCPAAPSPVVDGLPIIGQLTLSQLGLVLSSAFMVIALLVSSVHLMLHATHFSNKQEQARLMRIIFTVPVFALIAFIAILLGANGVFVLPWLAAWESVALANFFLLLCAYIAPDEQGQVAYFTSGKKNYRLFRWTWILVFQWIPVSFIVAIAEDATLATGKYCVTAFGPKFAKPYLVFAKVISIAIAIIALIRLTERLRPSLRSRHLRTQLWTFKSLIIFSTLLQFIFQMLSYSVKPTATIPLVDLSITLPMLVLSLTTAIYSIAFVFAFGWQPYMITERNWRGSNGTVRRYHGGPCGVKAIAHAFNPLDVLQNLIRATQLLFNRRMPEVMTPKYLSMSEESSGVRSMSSTASPQAPLVPNTFPRRPLPPVDAPAQSPVAPKQASVSSTAPTLFAASKQPLVPSAVPMHNSPTKRPSAGTIVTPTTAVSPRQKPAARRPELEKSLPPDPRSPFDTWSLYGASTHDRSPSAGGQSAYVPVRFSISESLKTPKHVSMPRGIANQPLPELGPRTPLPELDTPRPAVVRSVPVHRPQYTHGGPPPGDEIHDVIDEYRMTLYNQQNRF